jgi:hypothetical protein
MELTIVQILYNYAFEPSDKAMLYLSYPNRSFTAGYCRFSISTASVYTPAKRTFLRTVMPSGLAGREVPCGMFWSRRYSMSLFAL